MPAKKGTRKKTAAAKKAGRAYFVSILVGRKKGESEWSAVALDMDLWGFGATEEAALADLKTHVLMQISFAHFKKQPELVWKPSEAIYFEIFNQVKAESLKALVGAPRPGTARPEHRAAWLSVGAAEEQAFAPA